MKIKGNALESLYDSKNKVLWKSLKTTLKTSQNSTNNKLDAFGSFKIETLKNITWYYKY